MTLLASVAAILSEHGIAHALIGAAALAVHGVSRSTFDQDLLVLDAQVLDARFWLALGHEASVDVRRGDHDDPLAGVVRISRDGERAVDVVVGRHRWQRDALDRANAIGSHGLRAVQVADLILLKLYAGGTQDKWDVEQLLAIDSNPATVRTVDERIVSLPARSQSLWGQLRTRA